MLNTPSFADFFASLKSPKVKHFLALIVKILDKM